MSRVVYTYLAFLLSLIAGWVWARGSALSQLGDSPRALEFAGATLLYACAHIFRMGRLSLITLDQRDKIFALSAAHMLTAFPSSFLPFKMGEVLRLGAFLYVYDGKRKAFAVWLTERFGDALIIAIFILGLYLFDVRVPPAMQAVFVVFVLASAVGLLSLFAVSKVSIYLNRHLVLTSFSARGLLLLRTSHALRLLELDIHKSVDGRFSGFLLISMLIWVLEVSALALFMDRKASGESTFLDLFASALLASLANVDADTAGAFGLYQSLALVALTIISASVVWFAARTMRKGT